MVAVNQPDQTRAGGSVTVCVVACAARDLIRSPAVDPTASSPDRRLTRPVRSSKRLRALVIGAAALALVLLQLFALTATGVAARRASINVGRDAIGRVGDTTIQSILRHLEPAEQSAGVTSRLLADNLLDLGDPGLERYLYTQLAVMPQMTGAFVGFPDGRFVFVSREATGFRSKRIETAGGRSVAISHYDQTFSFQSSEYPTDDTYDPRTRPWYPLASTHPDLAWTDPYVFFSSGKPGVTAARAVRRGDELVAVVGVDVELSGLATFLDNLPVARSGQAFVVSGSNVVAAPNDFSEQTAVGADGKLRLLTVQELGVPALLEGIGGPARSITVGGGKDLVLHRAFPSTVGPAWSVIVRAPENDFTAPVRRQERATLWISIGGGALLAAGLLLMLRVTRPLVTLHDLASTDPLTGLSNRRALAETAEQLMVSARSDGSAVAVLVLDLDGFKALNDRHGHAVGDLALARVAATLRSNTRPRDVVARVGGDEFVVVQRAGAPADAVARAQRVLAAVQAALTDLDVAAGTLSASGGLALSGPAPTTLEALLAQADDALLAVKRTDKGRLEVARQVAST